MARGRPPTPLGTHGDFSYRELPGEKWEARTRYRGQNGKYREVRARGKSRNAAANALREKLNSAEVQDAENLTATSTIQVVCDHWLLQHDGVRGQTKDTYNRVIRKHIAPVIGDVRLNEITPLMLDKYLRGLSPGVAQNVYTVLNNSLTLCQRYGVRVDNPLSPVKKPQLGKCEVKVLTPEEARELRQLVHEDGSERLCDVFDMCFFLGLRLGEALALQWDDIDLEGDPPTVTINGTLVARTNERQNVPKTMSSRRVIALPGVLVEMLKRRSQNEVRAYCPLVFPSTALTPWSEANFNREFRKVKGERFKDVTVHTLRKTVGSRVSERSGVQAAAELLGHASTDMTERRYIRRGVASITEETVLDLQGN